jgi:RND family efflux transporter MFP subunit
LSDVEVDLQDSILRAPYDGYITRRYVDEGTTVSVAEPLFRIVERAPLEASIGVPPKAARSIAIGQSYDVQVGDSVYRAEATAVVAELNHATRTRAVILTLPGDLPQRLVPGETARLILSEPIETPGRRIPTAALVRGVRGLWSVYAANGAEDGASTVERRDVELLYADDDHALVRGLLREGDRIVASGTHRLVEGQRVKAVASPDAPVRTDVPSASRGRRAGF